MAEKIPTTHRELMEPGHPPRQPLQQCVEKIPTTHRELMERLVMERWHMLTMDTEVDTPQRIGEATVSEWWTGVREGLEYAASRLAGDGFEGEVDTRIVMEGLMDTIADALIAFGVVHRLGESVEAAA